LLKPLAEACHREGIKLGFYYSQAQDWIHPGGAVPGNRWDAAQEGSMDEYIEKIAVPQVKEILENYGGLDILWWDTPKDMTKERAEKFLPVINKYPNLVTNNRLGGGYEGDTETPEQFVPATGFPGRHWEVCMTMNDTWGYKSNDNNWKSTKNILQTLIDIVSKGGNYLLNVGPTAEGIIPAPSVEKLREVGKWMKTNGESVYGTTASPFHYLSWGRCTQKGNKLYLHVFNWPENGQLPVPLLNKVKKAYLLTNPAVSLKVKHTSSAVRISLPALAPDPNVSVVVLEPEGAPRVLPIPSAGEKVKTSSEKDNNISCTSLQKEQDKKISPDFYFKVVELDSIPVISRQHKGTEDNKYGFEGGRIVEIKDTLHWFTAEIFSDPKIVKMRIAHWKTKKNTDNWERVSTLYESSGEFTGSDTRSALWAPMPIYDEEKELWNLFYVSYRAKPNTDRAWYLNYDGRIWRSISREKGIDGISGPYINDKIILESGKKSDPWEGLQGTDSFFPFKVNGKWLGFYGSAQTQSRPCKFWGVGLAESEELSGPWERLSDLNPVDLKSDFAENPVVSKLDTNTFIALVDGGYFNNNFGFTISSNGTSWSDAEFIKLNDHKNKWWTLMRTPLCLIKEEDENYTIYFTAYTQDDFASLGKVKLKRIMCTDNLKSKLK
jgi:hypothetical protein